MLCSLLLLLDFISFFFLLLGCVAIVVQENSSLKGHPSDFIMEKENKEIIEVMYVL
jgi:hypothetical protein